MPSTRVACPSGRSLPQRTIHRFGWRPDLPDSNDFDFDAKAAAAARRAVVPQVLPEAVDLRDSGFMPPVYDQGNLGSCTANAIAGAYEFEQKRQGLTDFMPSRLFIYYNERVIEGDPAYDAGAQIRDGMKAVATLGVPSEQDWPYDISRFAEKPTDQAFADALEHQCITYARVTVAPPEVKRALATGVPVVLGFTVFESFEDTGSNGIVKPGQGQVLGGHAVLAVGYKKIGRSEHIIVRNSWGPAWGDKGYCYFPASWLCNTRNADDFWAIQSVEAQQP